MEKSILVQKIEDMIGPGRQFSSTNELAQYLGLGSTKHTKFYDFLEGLSPNAGIDENGVVTEKK